MERGKGVNLNITSEKMEIPSKFSKISGNRLAESLIGKGEKGKGGVKAYLYWG